MRRTTATMHRVLLLLRRRLLGVRCGFLQPHAAFFRRPQAAFVRNSGFRLASASRCCFYCYYPLAFEEEYGQVFPYRCDGGMALAVHRYPDGERSVVEGFGPDQVSLRKQQGREVVERHRHVRV